MKVNVYGLTDATISFNSIGMILRGKYSKTAEDFCSVARNVTLNSDAQINELMAIEKLGLIRVEILDRLNEQEKKTEEVISVTSTNEAAKENPRRSKIKEHKNETPVAKVPPAPEELIPASDLRVPTLEEIEKESRCVVMTESGPAGGKMVHKMNGELNDNDPRCKASMEAAIALKAEEERLIDLLDDDLLDPSERMGSSAVIGTGGKKTSNTKMRNSFVAEREEPNFIDLGLDDEDETIQNAFSDDSTESSFIDNDSDDKEVENAFVDPEDEDEDSLGDAFIEI